MALTDTSKITVAQIAYLAGIIDGEGCIHILKQRKGKFVYYTLFMQVANTDPKLMLWIQEIFGGNVRPRKLCRSNKRNVWQWVLAARQAEEVLRLVIPFLVVKKDQAELSLQFRDSYVGNRPYGGKGLSPDVQDFRMFCYTELKRMKVPRATLEVSCPSVQ